ncbi:heptaprenyl diphosphate synthase [Sporobacter termitidis DSM 10068]|uniref:Heptaprenyl diphosphate synthase n=1 Tax=Sporobacter termitidis DSM 10068 TaxID=1123282 RepID=A0A1M5XRR8_9FIRM|nr:polyprenyl synthetase family protein [Sporobacter termitidis]SHI02238.1 heptaprenyl diphosphate synthase [Sporobacter termitidis DSM 10068]
MTDACAAPAPRKERLSFDAAAGRTAEELNARLKGTPAIIRRLTVHLSKAAGKNIRARSLLACAMGRDGLIHSDAACLAAAVELLHLATLVHDDVIDGAARRRGIAALHKKFGEKAAILCGDYLFCLSLELASAVEPPADRRVSADRTLSHYMSDILLGELRQDQNNGNFALTERQYFSIIGGKTAAMFEASFYAGFLLSDEPDEAGERFKEIGRNIGLIFQLADDCADYEASHRTAGKPVLSDFKTGVVTLPLIYALKKDAGLLARIKAGLGPAALKKAVSSAGGLQYARDRIAEYFEKTRDFIAALPSPPEKKDMLSALLGKAAGRGAAP